MNLSPENITILLVAFFGSIVTVMMSEWTSWKQSIAKTVSGFAVALVFTKPFMMYLEINPAYAGAVGFLLGMLGSGIAKSIVEVSNDPTKAKGFLGLFFDLVAVITGQSGKSTKPKDDDQ